MFAELIIRSDGHIVVPVAAYGANGEMGDAVLVIGSGDERYAAYLSQAVEADADLMPEELHECITQSIEWMRDPERAAGAATFLTALFPAETGAAATPFADDDGPLACLDTTAPPK